MRRITLKHPEIGAGVLDDMGQKMIANLERGKDQVELLVAAVREAYERLTEEAGSVRRMLDAVLGEFALLEARVRAAETQLGELVKAGGTDIPAVLKACEALSEARTGLCVAREREQGLLRHLQSLDAQAAGAGQMSAEGSHLAGELGGAIQFLATNFRTLGSQLENAQQSRALGLHVIRAQEEERRRLAREIHDGPTQLLNSVVLRIDVCQRFFDTDLERVRGELQQLKELVRLSLQDVRKIIFDLRPMTLDDLGVVPALRTFLKDYQAKTGIETDFSVFGNDRRYDSTFEVAIFRIVQEALTNVSKHAGASRVWVKVETTGGKEIKVQVKDDGAGFDASKVVAGVAGSKFGLVAMRERTELLGGSMEIHSAPSQGTKLNFLFPLAE
jgi:two-component system, NarL family, sensor histidine kinase DegS